MNNEEKLLKALGEDSMDFSAAWHSFLNQLYRYVGVLKQRWWIPFLTTAIGLALASWYAVQLPPSFLSTARIMIGGTLRLAENAVYSEELGDYLGTQMELIKSGEVARGAAARISAEDPNISPTPVNFTLELQPKTSIFVLRAVAQDGLYAQRYLDASIAEYRLMRKKMRSEKSETTLTALSTEAAAWEAEMRACEDELLEFQQVNNLGYLREEGNSAAVRLASLNRQYDDLKLEHDLLGHWNLDQLLDRQAAGAASGNALPNARAESMVGMFGPTADYRKASQEIKLLEAEQAKLSRFMRPRHPDMIRVAAEISETQQLIKIYREQSVEQISNRIQAIAIEMTNLSSAKKELESKAVAMSRKIAEHDKIRGKLDRVKEQHGKLVASVRDVAMSQSIDQEGFSILEHASVPSSVRPGLLSAFLLAFGCGSILGFAIVLVMERVDDRITSLRDVHRHFSEEIVGQIIHAENADPIPCLQSNDPRHAFAESFRSIRSFLFFLPAEKHPKTVLVTSAIPGEGKSTVAANLAISIAHSGSRTLLIDCDLRRGTLHRALGMSNEIGFSEVLKGEIAWGEAVQPTAIENLSVILRGQTIENPSERILSSGTDRLLREASAAYDYVIIDTAPILVADDTTSLAPKVDATICVVRFGHSSVRFTRRILELLKGRRAQVLGLILNDISSSVQEYNYYGAYSKDDGGDVKKKERSAA